MADLYIEQDNEAIDYLRLSLAQESLQAPVELVEPVQYRELDELSGVSRGFCDGIDEMCDAALATEGIVEFVCDRYEKNELTDDTLKVANVALETYMGKLGVKMLRPISMESFKSNNIAQEGLFSTSKMDFDDEDDEDDDYRDDHYLKTKKILDDREDEDDADIITGARVGSTEGEVIESGIDFAAGLGGHHATGSALNAVGSTMRGVGSVASGAGSVLGATISGAGAVIGGAVKTVGFVKDVVVGTAGIVKDTVVGTYKIGKGIAGFVKDVTVAVYRFIKKKLVLLARHVVKLLGSFARARRKLESRIRDAEKLMGQVNRAKPLVPYIKAESWCEYLCYTKKPFSKGLDGIAYEVTTLVEEHTKMSKFALSKYLNFMKELDRTEDPIDRLRVSSKEFLLPGMKEFNRSLRFESPKRDNVFFQTHELPGGRAFYTQVNPVDVTGVEAVRTLEVVDFQVYYHDPASYDTFKMKLAAAIGIPMSVFLTLVNPLIGAGALAATGTYIATRDTHKGSDVKIDPSTIFECLSLDEAKRSLQEVREGLSSLKKWGDVVLTDPWKSQDIDELVLSICDRDETTSNMKAYCNSVLSVMNRLTVDVHSYAFRVYNAMINFIEKSLKQYR